MEAGSMVFPMTRPFSCVNRQLKNNLKNSLIYPETRKKRKTIVYKPYGTSFQQIMKINWRYIPNNSGYFCVVNTTWNSGILCCETDEDASLQRGITKTALVTRSLQRVFERRVVNHKLSNIQFLDCWWGAVKKMKLIVKLHVFAENRVASLGTNS